MTIKLKHRSWLIGVLIITTGCIRTAKTSTPPWKAPCLLFRGSGPAILDYDDARRAVADFQSRKGNRYSALYVETTAGSTNGRCIRICQKEGSVFEIYRYQGELVDSMQINNPLLSLAFAQIHKGHYSPTCRIFISEATSSVLLAKNEDEVFYSLVWQPQQWEHMHDSIQVQLAAGRELQHQIREVDDK
jgi:hypothetical protein